MAKEELDMEEMEQVAGGISFFNLTVASAKCPYCAHSQTWYAKEGESRTTSCDDCKKTVVVRVKYNSMTGKINGVKCSKS